MTETFLHPDPLHPAPAAPRRAATLRITPVTREHLILSLWIAVTFTQFPKDELLLYPLALYFAWAILRDGRRIAPLVARGWVLLLFPAWSILSVVWAVEPEKAFRIGLQVALTVMICFHAAAWLTPRRIILSLFVAGSAIGVLSLGSALSASDAARGIFTHKNVLGSNMTLLWVTSLCVLLDRGFPRWLRLLAPVAAVLALVLVIHSHSATAILLSIACGGVALFGAVFLREGSLLATDRLALLFAVLAVVCAAAAAVLAVVPVDPVGLVLEALGKDRTITGRTGLWAYAEMQIADRPLLGLGNGGFWRYEASPLVQRIFEEYHRGRYAFFSFHNSYLEITIHLGYVGLALAVLAFVWAGLTILRGAMAFGEMPRVWFLAILVIMAARSFVESDLFGPFFLVNMLVWIGALMAVRTRLEAGRPVPVPRVPGAGAEGERPAGRAAGRSHRV